MATKDSGTHVGRGRPTIRTEENAERIIHALKLGLSRNRAADYGRVGRVTFADWLNTDQDFLKRCLEAEAEGIAHHAQIIHGAVELPKETASPAVAAAKFYLSTHDRENFCEKVQVEHSGHVTLSDLFRRVNESDDDPDDDGSDVTV
jgi:hypothetical protein